MAPRSVSGSTSASTDSYSMSSIDDRPNRREKHDYDETGSYTSDDHEYEYASHEPILRAEMGASKAGGRKSTAKPQNRRIPNRIMRWVCMGLMGSILIFIFILVRASQNSGRRVMEWGENRPPPREIYEDFPFLTRYYGGLRSLVIGGRQMVREYPNVEGEALPAVNQDSLHEVPKSIPYNHLTQDRGAVECFMDEEETIPIPKLHIHQGLPMGFPEAVYGSHELLNLNDSICFDRYGRYGPYGFGYTMSRGGLSAGTEGEKEGAEEVWRTQEQVDYRHIRWADLQRKCAKKNAHRFTASDGTKSVNEESLRTMNVDREIGNEPLQSEEQTHKSGAASTPMDATSVSSTQLSGVNSNSTSTSTAGPNIPSHSTPSSEATKIPSSGKKVPRQAVLIRTWNNNEYTPENLMYLRSLVSELALASGAEYDIHFLIEVKNNSIPIWADDETYETMLNASLPEEFSGMGTLWSEGQMEFLYGPITSEHPLTATGRPVLGAYRAAHLPVQWFAHQHPEYDFFWNWEMDIRFTGNWHDLFSGAAKFAALQPRKGLWERSHRFYIPSVHGSWEDFKHMVRVQSEMPAQEPQSKWANMGPDGEPIPLEPYDSEPVWGPRWPKGDQNAKPFDDDPIPPHSYEKDRYEWGVGEEADLITFHPLFDPARTTWTLQDDYTGYNEKEDGTQGMKPPRRSAIVAAGRLSKRLLDRMHRETALRKHSMFTEMFAPTMALHHGLKAVYAPHPVFIDRVWPVKYLASVFNAGPNGVTGGAKQTIFGDCCQGNMLGITWHYISGFSPNLWKRWLGLQVDGNGGEQSETEGEGRMCLPPMLFHPIKEVELPIERPPEGILIDEHAMEVGGSIPHGK